jgi:sulfatase maturation enzyme AslB (radical SAM superfamily)
MVGQMPQFSGLNVTLNICECCNLRCKYCYETGKAQSPSEDLKFWKKVANSKDPGNAALGKDILENGTYSWYNGEDCGDSRVIKLDTVCKFFDMATSKSFHFPKDYCNSGIVVDMIGGDALEYPELLDQITEYMIYKMYKGKSADSEFANIFRRHWRMSISSNGVTLLNDDAKNFLEKWTSNVSMGISIDGHPELHDRNRILYVARKDGNNGIHEIGSSKYIQQSFGWYRENFPIDSLTTKWTISPNSYKDIVKSVKYLHENAGMIWIYFNRAMEDNVQDTPEDVFALYKQYQELFEYVKERDDEIFVSNLY